MKLLRIPEVAARVNRGKSTIYAAVKAGTFPAPVRQGGGNYWPDTEIDAYLVGIMSARPTSQPSAGS